MTSRITNKGCPGWTVAQAGAELKGVWAGFRSKEQATEVTPLSHKSRWGRWEFNVGIFQRIDERQGSSVYTCRVRAGKSRNTDKDRGGAR
jgi:hypothetical protein